MPLAEPAPRRDLNLSQIRARWPSLSISFSYPIRVAYLKFRGDLWELLGVWNNVSRHILLYIDSRTWAAVFEGMAVTNFRGCCFPGPHL